MGEEHHVALLRRPRWRKPRLSSGDRACLLIFAVVALSVLLMGPSVVWKDEIVYREMTFVDLRWFMWTEERTDMLRRHISIESLSMLQELPGLESTYTLYQTKWMDIGNLSFSMTGDATAYELYLSNASRMEHVGSLTSALEVAKDGNWSHIHVLQRQNEPGKLVSAAWNNQELKHWTVFPGLLGEQLQLFNPMWMNSVPWQPLVSSHIPPLTWIYSIVHTSFPTKAQAQMHFHAPGLTHGSIYWNGQLLGLYHNGDFTGSVHLGESNYVVIVDEIGAFVAPSSFSIAIRAHNVR